jgi:capsular exopolysaccharide synthesis family protein
MANGQSLVPSDPESKPGSSIYLPTSVLVQPSRHKLEVDWEQALRVLQKNWRTSLVFALSVTMLITILMFRTKNLYEPMARLEIDPPGSEMFSLRDLLNSGTNDQDYLQTQVQILGSDELAVSVIRTLRLDQNPDIVSRKELEEAKDQNSEQAPSGTQLTPLENTALRSFRKLLTVNQIRNSRLVEVSFVSHDARLAAQTTNTLVNTFIDRNYRNRYEATMQASEWLQGQLSDLRQKVEQSNQALVDYQRVSGIVDVDDRQNTVTQKVGDLNRQLTQAEAERIQLQAYLKMIESGNADSLAQIRNNLLLQTSSQRFAEARAQLAQALAIYGKNNSNVKKLQSQADELEAQVNAERQRVIEEIKTSYAAAQKREELMAQALNEMKGIIGNMNEKMIQYNVLKNEAQANAELYNALLGRLKEAGISAGLKSSNIRVVDQARVLDRPTGPHRLRNIALGLIVGLLGGIALAFLQESLDNTLRTPEDVRAWTGLSSLAMFPLITSPNGHSRRPQLPGATSKPSGNEIQDEQARAGRTLFLEKPRSPEAEAVRSLHTSIMLSRPGKPPRVILVVSPSPGEGKSTVAANLASVLAEHAKACLVDADLRRPTLARVFGVANQSGLSHVLTGSASLDAALARIPDRENLTIVPAGPIPPNPGELMASESMSHVIGSLRERFEYVVIDSPPFIPFADGRALLRLTDGIVLVGRCGKTTRQSIVRSLEILTELHASVLGVVLNGVDIRSPDYHYYHYGYSYSYRYGYGSEYEQVDEEEEG